MKRLIFIKLFPLVVLLACNTQNQQTPTPATQPPAAAPAPKAPTMTERPAGAVTKKMDHVKFASKYDPVCGMPLSAGIEDTAHYKHKIYGFCATGCKEEFVKDPVGTLAQQ